jgi:inosine/xanthosine triphosphatase
MKKVIIASANPVKIEATKIGFEKMFPEEVFSFEGISAPSGVSDQPMSRQETLTGATNRANNVSDIAKDADFWVGIEGGIEDTPNGMEAFAYMVVKSKVGKIGVGNSGSFLLPIKVTDLIKEGHELGAADDIVFGRSNSKQANGAVGLLTKDIITRTIFYTPSVILALIPFKNPDLY